MSQLPVITSQVVTIMVDQLKAKNLSREEFQGAENCLMEQRPGAENLNKGEHLGVESLRVVECFEVKLPLEQE